jgi:uracil-DNA glycosylase
MANYSCLDNANALYELVVKGVHPDWMSADVEEELRIILTCIYNTSKNYPGKRFLPDPDQVMAVFRLIKPSDVKVVILGQDPYPNAMHAMGVAFTSLSDVVPASAHVINANLLRYGHVKTANSANYLPWLSKGVLLANMSLTVEESKPASHSSIWGDRFLSLLFRKISTKSVGVAFGRAPQSKISNVLKSSAFLATAHPSPQAGKVFSEKDIFGEINAALTKLKLEKVDWNFE